MARSRSVQNPTTVVLDQLLTEATTEGPQNGTPSANLLDQIQQIIDGLPVQSVPDPHTTSSTNTGYSTGGSSVPAVTDLILLEAMRRFASDIHFEPRYGGVFIRFRIDGVMREVLRLPEVFGRAAIRRVKVLAGMNLVEHRHPQDGQMSRTLGSETVDFRVSTAPTVAGENAVLRLFRGAHPLALNELGMPSPIVEVCKQLLSDPFGMILAAGPTGHGKTSTLYAMLGSLDAITRNVVTIEDPVEHRLDNITQINVSNDSSVDFNSGLRAIMRQDPDVIMVGEIRDAQTARIAARAAITGHLVMSSVHSIDAASALHRFLDMEMEPYEIASAITVVLAQRLIRRICPECSTLHTPSAAEAELFRAWGGTQMDGLRIGRGCENCSGSGYAGRTGIFECLLMTDEIRALLYHRAPVNDLRKIAQTQGMRTMQQHSAELIAMGITTIAEVQQKLGLGARPLHSVASTPAGEHDQP